MGWCSWVARLGRVLRAINKDDEREQAQLDASLDTAVNRNTTALGSDIAAALAVLRDAQQRDLEALASAIGELAKMVQGITRAVGAIKMPEPKDVVIPDNAESFRAIQDAIASIPETDLSGVLSRIDRIEFPDMSEDLKALSDRLDALAKKIERPREWKLKVIRDEYDDIQGIDAVEIK